MVSALLPLFLSTAYYGADIEKSGNNNPIVQTASTHRQDTNLPPYPGLYMPSTYYRPNWMLNYLLPPVFVPQFSNVTYDKDTFKITLNLKQYKLEEIDIKVIGRQISVSAKHEEKKEGVSASSQQVSRSFAVPDNVVLEKITSTFSSDGILTIQAPVKESSQPKSKERTVKIELTNKPAVEPKVNKANSTTTSAPEVSTTTDLPSSTVAE